MVNCCQSIFGLTNFNRVFTVLLLLLIATLPQPARAQEDADQAAARIANTAINAQKSSDFEFAVDEWEKIISDHPRSSYFNEAHYQAGVCYHMLGDDQKAINRFRQGLKLIAKEKQVLRSNSLFLLGFSQQRLGRQLLENKQTDQARKFLTTATETFADLKRQHEEFADLDQAFYFQGVAFELLGRLDESRVSFEKALKEKGKTFEFETLFALANVNEQLGRFDVALNRYDEFINKANGEHSDLNEVKFRKAITLIELAESSKNIDDTKGAQQQLEQAKTILADVSSVPGFALLNDAIFEHAKILSRQNQHKASAALFAKIADTESEIATLAAVRAGQELLFAKDYSGAEAILNPVLNLNDSQSPWAAHWLCQVYLQTNAPTKAQAVAQEWLTKTALKHACHAPLMLDLGDAVYAQNDFPGSAKLYMDLVNEHPEHILAPTSLYNAAFSEFKAKSFEGAIKLASNFIDSHPQHERLPDAMQIEADSYAASEQHELAAKSYETLVAKYPKHPQRHQWLLGSALALYQQQKSTEIQPLLSPHLETMKPSERAEAYHWIGLAYFQEQKDDQAIEFLSKALDTSTDYRRTDETMIALARSYRRAGNNEMAESTLSQMQNTQGDSRLLAEALYRKGDVAYEERKYEIAKESFAIVVEKHGDSSFAPFAMYKLGWCDIHLAYAGQQNLFRDAEKSFSELLNSHKNHELTINTLLARGMCRRQLGEFPQALTDFNQALEMKLTKQQRKDALYEKGLCHIGAEDWTAVRDTFKTLIDESPAAEEAPKFYYELAWAQTYLKANNDALATFAKLAERFPKHPDAAEAQFHLGNAAYEKQDFEAAAKAYEISAANEKAAKTLREKAIHKLGWAQYKNKDFMNAETTFKQQLDRFPNGLLAADGRVMYSESLMQQKKYAEAAESYRVARPIVSDASVAPNFRWITYLHGSQAANQSKQFDEAIEFANAIIESDDASNDFKLDAYLELGNAYQGKKMLEQAVAAWEVAGTSLTKTGARARCMVGDVLMGQKKFEDAIRMFKRVVFDFGGKQAPSDIKPWQAFASYEIARCFFSRVKSEQDADVKQKLVEKSIEWFSYLVTNFPDDKLRPQAEKQLNALRELNRQ